MPRLTSLFLFSLVSAGMFAAEPATVAPPKPAPKPTIPVLSDFAKEPSTFCRFVPERADDFAWENDRVAFRAYGPAISARHVEDSGVDCWPKRVEHPIINSWYAGAQKGLSYHEDRGEGCDQYHVGRSRGCGGTALWINDHMVTPGPYIAWHVEECGRERSAFTLTYRYPAAAGEEPVMEAKSFEILLGNDWFTTTSTFTRGGKPLTGQEVVAGVTTHDGKGTATLDPAGRWLSVWEEIKEQDTGFLGTGLALPNGAVLKEIKTPKPTDSSHALAILTTDAAGSIRFRAGFALVRAGRIATAEAWQQVLAKAAADL
jgi:Domain of unknown function (DUF4861)